MENLHLLPDKELVILFKNGNNPAFEILINRHKDEIYSYLLFVLHNKFKVEDVLQNTFLKAMLTIRDNRYQENGKFKFWIQRIAHNTLIDFLRFEKSEQKIFTDNFGLDLYNDYRLSEGTIEDRIVYKQVCRNVKKMLKFLPDDQQEILVLRYYNGLTYKEIAIYLGVSVNTALGRVRYAIRNMRKMTKIHTTILSLS